MRKLLIAASFLAPLTLAAMGSSSALAQQQDWGKWQPSGGAKPDGQPITPGGISYGAKECQPSHMSGKAAYWVCSAHCTDPNKSFCWEAVSDAIYVCENENGGYRHQEWFRTTNQPCGPEDWKRTVHIAEDIYHETWTKNVTGTPQQPTETVTPPTTDDGLPPNSDDEHKPSWGGGIPPWHKEETEKKDGGATDQPKTDQPKTDQPKTDQPKTDQPKTDQPKTDQPKTDSGKSDQSKTNPGKSAPSKTDQSKSETPRNPSQDNSHQTKQDTARQSPSTATTDRSTPSLGHSDAHATRAVEGEHSPTTAGSKLRSPSTSNAGLREAPSHLSQIGHDSQTAMHGAGAKMGGFHGMKMGGLGGMRMGGVAGFLGLAGALLQ